MSSAFGTLKRIEAGFWPVLEPFCERIWNISSCSILARQQTWTLPESTVTWINRGSTFALRRSTLDLCLGGQLSWRAAQRAKMTEVSPTRASRIYAPTWPDHRAKNFACAQWRRHPRSGGQRPSRSKGKWQNSWEWRSNKTPFGAASPGASLRILSHTMHQLIERFWKVTPPHKIVDWNKKSTILWRNWLSKTA